MYRGCILFLKVKYLQYSSSSEMLSLFEEYGDSLPFPFPHNCIDISTTIKPLKDHGITFDGRNQMVVQGKSLCILAKAPSFMTQNHFQERLSNASKLTNKQTKKHLHKDPLTTALGFILKMMVHRQVLALTVQTVRMMMEKQNW